MLEHHDTTIPSGHGAALADTQTAPQGDARR